MKKLILICLLACFSVIENSNAQVQHNFVPLDHTAFVVGMLESPRLKVNGDSKYKAYLTGFNCEQQYLRPYFLEALYAIKGLDKNDIKEVSRYASSQYLLSQPHADYFNAYFTFESFNQLDEEFKNKDIQKGYADISKFTSKLEQTSFLIGFTVSKGSHVHENVYQIAIPYNMHLLKSIFDLSKSLGFKTEITKTGALVYTMKDTAYNEYLQKLLKEKEAALEACK